MSLTDALGLLTDRKPNGPYAGIYMFIIGGCSSANGVQHNQAKKIFARHVWFLKKHTCWIMYAEMIAAFLNLLHSQEKMPISSKA